MVAVYRAFRSLASVAVPMVELDLTDQHITCEGARTKAEVRQVHCGLLVVCLQKTRIGDEGAAARVLRSVPTWWCLNLVRVE